MNNTGERQFVYLGLLIACIVVAFAAGPMAGLWTFFQVGAVIELTYWLGSTGGGYRKRRSLKL